MRQWVSVLLLHAPDICQPYALQQDVERTAAPCGMPGAMDGMLGSMGMSGILGPPPARCSLFSSPPPGMSCNRCRPCGRFTAPTSAPVDSLKTQTVSGMLVERLVAPSSTAIITLAEAPQVPGVPCEIMCPLRYHDTICHNRVVCSVLGAAGNGAGGGLMAGSGFPTPGAN